jgi:hypothetical protein
MSDDGQMDFEGGGDEGYYDPDEIKSASIFVPWVKS